MVFFLAQIAPPQQPVKNSPPIHAPAQPSPKDFGAQQIRAPGFGDSTKDPNIKTENPTDREKRLQDAGVLPQPTPPPDKRPKVLSEFDKLANSAASADGTVEGTERRFRFQIGSWWAPLKPSNTTYKPDLSYGVGYLQAFQVKPFVIGKWTQQSYWGVGLTTYNGETTVKYNDETDTQTSTTAATNYTEIGGELTTLRQKTFASGHGLGTEFTARFYPLRFVKSRYTANPKPPADSEVTQRLILNYAGLGGGFNAYYTFAQFFKTGLYTDVNFAAPFQMRWVVGLSFELTQQMEKKVDKPKEEAKP